VEREDRSPRGSRAEALRLLAGYDLGAVARWAAREARAVPALQRVLSDADERLRSRAAEALGAAAEAVGRSAPDRVPDLVRRVLWHMSDESGGILWSAPEAVGAILARVPALCPEFGPILASFVDEEPFRVGTRWALWRLARTSPETVRLAAGGLRASLADEDAGVRGHAALALGAVGAALPELDGDVATLAVFDPRTGERRTVTVAEAASGRI
jgi:HEAT repeat protein